MLALHEHLAVDTFKKALPGILIGLVPADFFHLMEFEISPKADRGKLVALTDPSRQIKPNLAQYVEDTLFVHPFPKYFAQTGDSTALKLSDFYTLPQLRETEFYERFYGPVGVRRQLTVPANLGPHTIGAVTLCSAGRDFTERDRLILNLLRPHIEQASRNASLMTAWKQDCTRPLAAYRLTPREAEVAHWMAAGKTNPEIAIILQSNARTVENHMGKILEKMGVENRTAAAVLIATSSGQTMPLKIHESITGKVDPAHLKSGTGNFAAPQASRYTNL